MTASFPPDVRHRNLERLVVEVVRTAIDRQGKRLLLIVEDAQWMNQLSMKLLLKASKNMTRANLCACSRGACPSLPSQLAVVSRMKTSKHEHAESAAESV